MEEEEEEEVVVVVMVVVYLVCKTPPTLTPRSCAHRKHGGEYVVLAGTVGGRGEVGGERREDEGSGEDGGEDRERQEVYPELASSCPV
ncbi:hypothetical protein E2C01_100661 [Portunus trituberculatus]|uniref:Uncharacterized protein n=1 Tax=Portunus trituberculatus TaxID=210409 RepID=A0A5B7KE55_PORTR|nr:hypothetical protein [Portunus trituberculatus]